MNVLVHLIERVRLVIGSIRSTLIVADGHAVVVGLREFAAQPNVVNLRGLCPEVRRKAQRQVVHPGELHHFGRVLDAPGRILVQAELLVALGLRIVERHLRPVLEQLHLSRMRLVVRSDHDQALQLDVSGERNVEQQFGVAVALHELGEVQAILVRFEDELPGAGQLLVQALQIQHVDLLVQTVLDAHLQGVVDVGGLVVAAAAAVVVTVGHFGIF